MEKITAEGIPSQPKPQSKSLAKTTLALVLALAIAITCCTKEPKSKPQPKPQPQSKPQQVEAAAATNIRGAWRLALGGLRQVGTVRVSEQCRRCEEIWLRTKPKQTNKQTKQKTGKHRYYTPHVKRFPLQLLGCFLGARHSLGYSSLREREAIEQGHVPQIARKARRCSMTFLSPRALRLGRETQRLSSPCAPQHGGAASVSSPSSPLSPSSRPLRLSLSRRASAQRCRHVSLWCSLPCSRSAPRLLMRPRAAE